MKKLLTKVFCALLVVVLATATVACGGGSDDTQTQGGEETLQIRVLKKGYGDQFVEELAKAFCAKNNLKYSISSSSLSTQIDAELVSGPKTNQNDVYFLIGNIQSKLNEGTSYVSGYDGLVFEDLTSIYDTNLEGYSKSVKLRDAILPYALEASQYNGKEYGVSWATALEGLVYNENLMIEFFGENYHTPRTTDEMFSMFNTIKNGGNYTQKTYEGTTQKYSIYPFVYPGNNDYMQYIFLALWAQYDGIDSYYNMLKGQDENGNYTADIFATDGRLAALEVVHDMITIGDADRAKYDGNVSLASRSYNFTQSQVKFLEGEAVFSVTGDWVEREMEGNFKGNNTIKFMKMPIVSSIIEKIPDKSITDDATLQNVVDAIDNGQTSYTGVTANDFNYIKNARSIYNCEAENHMIVVPAYSDNKENAKKFIQFCLSKEGQEIQMKYSYGNCAPLSVDDVSTFEASKSFSKLTQSKFDILKNVTYVGRLYNQPITYAGGMTLLNFTTGYSLEGTFGITTTSSSYKTASDLFQLDYQTAQTKFVQWKRNANIA